MNGDATIRRERVRPVYVIWAQDCSAAAFCPAMRPWVRHSDVATLPRRQAPWMPPTTSPAA